MTVKHNSSGAIKGATMVRNKVDGFVTQIKDAQKKVNKLSNGGG